MTVCEVVEAMRVAGARAACRPAPGAAHMPIACRAAVAVALLLSACASLPQSAPRDAEPGSIDAELFRLVMERQKTRLPMAIRVDPRPLPGSPMHWYIRGPVFAEGVSAGVIDERRRILAEFGIVETDIERDSRCRANPHEESYVACPEAHYDAIAASLAWSGTNEEFEPCAATNRCVMRTLLLTMTPTGMAIAIDDFHFSWDGARGQWVIADIVNLWVT